MRGPDKKPRSAETRRRMASAKLGAKNGVWRGDAVQYVAAHERVRRALGRASDRSCKCGRRARDWANLTGKYTDVTDFEAMCRSCHMLYDHQRIREEGQTTRLSIRGAHTHRMDVAR